MQKWLVYTAITGVVAIVALIWIALTLHANVKRIYPVPILMYHEIGEVKDSPWCVPIETFRSQMVSLRTQGFKAILPSDITAHREWGKPLPRKPVIITFDDGYLCNLTSIEPILKQNGLRAVIYLITDQEAETAAARREYEGKKCLIWPEVLAMQKRRTFVFGGHSHSHGNLAAFGDPWSDISECRKQLKLHNIREPYSFCYPYGQQNERAQKAVRQAKFQTAVICEDAVAIIGPATNLFALPRVSVMGGGHEFRLVAKTSNNQGKTAVYQIWHQGIPIEISACLRGNNNETVIWLPVREVRQEKFELRFVPPDNIAEHERNFVEIWDKHRLFKLATIGQ